MLTTALLLGAMLAAAAAAVVVIARRQHRRTRDLEDLAADHARRDVAAHHNAGDHPMAYHRVTPPVADGFRG
ncbi:hypothetical protein [Streptomyces sp. NPDC089919]|uniref:hypothetical protein n=1 Tax=Streptomyces sp. NPDC089919 TaxID=3155188 RepID=UPI00341A7558